MLHTIRKPHSFIAVLCAAVLLTACTGNNKESENEVAVTTATPVMIDPIADTSWKAVKIFNREAGAAESILNLSGDNKSSGNTGCNNFQGAVEINNSNLKFGLLATTRKFCTPAINGQEKAFLEALEATRTWVRTGDTLQLKDESNAVAMELIPTVN
jgi:heat shock protein HslJ